MATKYQKDKVAWRILKKVLKANDTWRRLEMSNIPKEMWMSAAASELALMRPQRWVFVPLDNGPALKFDIRKNKEA